MSDRRSQTNRTAAQAHDEGTRPGERIHNPDGFKAFWAAYPKRVGRLAVIREWNRLKPDATLVEQMLKALDWQQISAQWQQGYIPDPRTWLHQGRWMDEPIKARQRASWRPEPAVYEWVCLHSEPKCLHRHACHIREIIEAERAKRKKA